MIRNGLPCGRAFCRGTVDAVTRRLFHYQKFVEPYFASLLSDRQVKLSRADSFNDPWDCRLRFRYPQNEAERKRVLKWLDAQDRKLFPGRTEIQRAILIHAFRSEP